MRQPKMKAENEAALYTKKAAQADLADLRQYLCPKTRQGSPVHIKISNKVVLNVTVDSVSMPLAEPSAADGTPKTVIASPPLPQKVPHEERRR